MPTRADARRNREKLVVAARAAFADADGAVSLERVARAAGVGIGTLYRHFPTREELAEAVYAAELDEVTASAAVLLAQLPPEVALRTWMDRYAAFIATKRGMIESLRAGWASQRLAVPVTRRRITGVLAEFLAAGAAADTLRADVDPEDVTVMLVGVFLAVGADAPPDQVERLLDLVADAVRAGIADR